MNYSSRRMKECMEQQIRIEWGQYHTPHCGSQSKILTEKGPTSFSLSMGSAAWLLMRLALSSRCKLRSKGNLFLREIRAFFLLLFPFSVGKIRLWSLGIFSSNTLGFNKDCEEVSANMGTSFVLSHPLNKFVCVLRNMWNSRKRFLILDF